MKNAIALIAVAGIAGAASAQSYEVVLNGGTNEVTVNPGETVDISIIFSTGGSYADFNGLALFAINAAITGASEVGGFQGWTEQDNSVETAPVGGISPVLGFDTAPDTWVAGRRPGAGTAFGGSLSSNGWRFAPGTFIPATFSAGGVDGAVNILQDGSARLTGTQGSSAVIPAFTSEFMNEDDNVEILRFQYTASNIGDHNIELAY